MRKFKRIKLLGAVVVVTLLMMAIPSEAVTLKPSIEIDCPAIMADKTGTVYVVVQFDVPEIEFIRAYDRPNLNLAIVIDRSGSMADRGKMEYAKKAAMFVVDQMNSSDRLAVIEYDDRINVLWPSQRVTNKSRIKQRISRLEPRGATNLTGGMMRGVDEVYRAMSDGGINHVLLLSDGLANRGVTSHWEIQRLVTQARRDGVTITTIGLGLDYNEDLMQMIAQNGGGNYYFVEHPNQMRDIFDRELGAVYATVARDIKIKFRRAHPVRHIEVFGYLNELRGDDLFVDLGSVHGGEKISMVMRVELDPRDIGRANIGTIELDYVDVSENVPRKFTQDLSVEVTRDIKKVRSSQKPAVTAEATLVEADNFHEKQVRLYEEGRVDEAMANMSALAADLASRNEDLGDVRIAKKLEALEVEKEQIARAEKDAEYKAGFLKKQKSTLFESQQGMRGQYVQQFGDSGFEVKQLQQALLDKGFYSGPVDGKFSDETTEAVKKFQLASKLQADGVVGPKTLAKLGLY